MADSPMISRAERALRRLDGLNTLAYELNRLGRRAGLHDRVPWRERLDQVPDNAVPAPRPPAAQKSKAN